MAELLLRVHDKPRRGDVYLDSQQTQAGDVNTVQLDGWIWGSVELTHPDWRILRIPALTVEAAEVWLSPEPERSPTMKSRVLQRRGVSFSIAALTQADVSLTAWLADDTRRAPIAVASLSLAQIATLARVKTPLVDPAIIGADPGVIG